MTKIRIILFSIFGFYHLFAFAFTAYLDINKNDWGLLTKMLAKIPLFKYGTLLGLILIILDFILSWQASKKAEQAIADLQNEVNALKAKAYDLNQKK
jgi:hypothetical protein